MKKLTATAWLLCLSLCAIDRLSAAEYEVDGQLEQTTYDFDGSVQRSNTSQFTVFVRDCAWLVRITISNSNGIPVRAIEAACVNGTEIYKIFRPVDGRGDVLGRAGSLNQAFIVSNTVPIGPDIVGHIWQMFASSCYFQTHTNSRLTPAYDVGAKEDSMPYLKLVAQRELIDGPGSLPKSMTYYTDGNAVKLDLLLDATYKATGVTNAGSIKIPSGFVFERKRGLGGFGRIYSSTNRPVIDQYAATNRFKERCVGTVTAVRPYCSRKDLAPTARGRTVVSDLRALQEVWSPTLPTNPAEWLYQKGFWDGKTPNNVFSQHTNIPATLFRLNTPPPPRINTYYVVEDGVVWLPLAAAKQVYVGGNGPIGAAFKPSMIVTGITNGGVSFAYFDNTTGTRQTANINVLGMNVAVTQGAKPILAGVGLLANGSFQFGFSNNPGVSFTVWMATNLSLPLKDWTPVGAPSEIGSGQYQFTDPSATNDVQRFYRVTSP